MCVCVLPHFADLIVQMTMFLVCIFLCECSLAYWYIQTSMCTVIQLVGLVFVQQELTVCGQIISVSRHVPVISGRGLGTRHVPVFSGRGLGYKACACL